MSIDVEKNKNEVLAALNDLLNEKTATDWILLGYEGLTNTLRLYETGDGGIDEMAEELSVSKIMYAVVRVSDPKTSCNKNVLINWQGESAPNLRKGICSRHLADVKRLLKGVHITVNARNEDEVESSFILSAVAKASATDYNFSDRSEMPERNAPVGTNYKRTNPMSEINSNSRNKFWEEQEAEERVRKEQELNRKEKETSKLERERVEREVRETKQREEINKERNIRINAGKRAEERAIVRTSPNKSWGSEMEDHHKADIERATRADHMRQQRKKEAESLIGSKTCEKRSMFEVNCTPSNLLSTSKFETNRLPNNDISTPQVASDAVPKKTVGRRWPPIEEPVASIVPTKSAGKIAEWTPTVQQETNASFSHKQENMSHVQINQSNSFVPHPHEDFHLVETSTNGTYEEEPVRDQVSVRTNGMNNDEVGVTEESVNSPQKHSPEYYPITCEIDGVEYQLLPEHGLCARAIYDYQAADETEITFDPGDILTNIDQIDVGWWQGIGPSAKFGLFPANYVELINLNDAH